MALDAKTMLRRFCYLGSLDPVYVHLRQPVKVTVYWPKLQEICAALDDASFVQILSDVLHEGKLVRRDEALFAYAAYLATDLDIGWKTSVRNAFPMLARSDNDLFLFCKYSSLIGKARDHKAFSRTVRKAIAVWYEQRTPEDIRNMWLMHRGEHGFTHKVLIKLCRITDGTMGAADVAKPFFKSCTALLKDFESGDAPSTSAAVSTKAATASEAAPTAAGEVPQSVQNCGDEKYCNVELEKTKSTVEVSSSLVVSMSKLRTTKNKLEALKIIRKFNLHYNQVPKHLLCHPAIIEQLIPSMSYLQLLKSWRYMARRNHLNNPKILELCKKLLENKGLLHTSNIHPVVLLLQMHKLGIRGDLGQLPPRKVEALKMHYFKELYAKSFGENHCTGLRMHITINLQPSYKRKFLKNHRRLSFYDASVALAFGYFKREKEVEVYHWTDEDSKRLKRIPWTNDMDIQAAIGCCNNIQETKNKQRLVAPMMNALANPQDFDVFLTIVPTAGRGNPKKNPKFLTMFLEKYRQNRNSRAKYVIVDLLRFRKSMDYSKTHNENILEICGLDEHTTNLVTDFALNRFG